MVGLKKIIENRDNLKITKHLIFPICFCQREIVFNNLQIRYKSKINTHLIFPIFFVKGRQFSFFLQI